MVNYLHLYEQGFVLDSRHHHDFSRMHKQRYDLERLEQVYDRDNQISLWKRAGEGFRWCYWGGYVALKLL